MGVNKVPSVEEILSVNDQLATANRNTLDTHKVFSLNSMSSPDSGQWLRDEIDLMTVENVDISCVTGKGLDTWVDWLYEQVMAYQQA
jgi:hypothetical protein